MAKKERREVVMNDDFLLWPLLAHVGTDSLKKLLKHRGHWEKELSEFETELQEIRTRMQNGIEMTSQWGLNNHDSLGSLKFQIMYAKRIISRIDQEISKRKSAKDSKDSSWIENFSCPKQRYDLCEHKRPVFWCGRF